MENFFLNFKNKKNIKNYSKKRKTLSYSILNYPSKNKLYGNFKGKYPAQAAHKVLNFLAKKSDISNSNDLNQIMFHIQNRKTKKSYCYFGSRVKLNKPNIIKIKNKEVKFHYKTILRKCNIKSDPKTNIF